MSDNMRNRPGGDGEDNSKMSDASTENRNRSEGFEGMNYEQVRQPYNPQNNDRARNNPDTQSGNTRHDS